MTQWIAVPRCPGCREVMRPDGEFDGFYQCIGCGFIATSADLGFMGNDDEEEE